MARKRKTARRSSKRRRRSRKRGVGSVITVRRSKGIGAITGGNYLTPTAVGGSVSALTILAIRYFMPVASTGWQATLSRFSWLAGMVAGVASGFFLGRMGTKDQARKMLMGATAGATVVSLFALGLEQVRKARMADVATLAATSEGTGEGDNGMGAIVFSEMSGLSRGVGAIVPEYGGMDGMGSYGEDVSLAGLNTSVFGTPGWG